MHPRALFVLLFLGISSALFSQTETAKLKISPLIGDFYVYTTYNLYEEYLLPANGMYVVTEEGVVLFDTPWDTTQFQPLLDSIQMRHNKAVILCIATHWHSDRTEGLEYYKQLGIPTYTTRMTDELSAANQKKRAEFLMENDTLFNVGAYSFETYYPGEGHTTDNIVIWFEKEKILYGGCLIKGADAKNLGYMGDANQQMYYSTLKQVEAKYPEPEFIIISHSDWNDTRSLKHSIRLAKKLKRKSRD